MEAVKMQKQFEDELAKFQKAQAGKLFISLPICGKLAIYWWIRVKLFISYSISTCE